MEEAELLLGGDDDDLEEESNGDVVKQLPNRTELKRYEKKKRIGLQFLSSVSAQQMALLSPSLKESMDNFISQLETHTDQVENWGK